MSDEANPVAVDESGVNESISPSPEAHRPLAETPSVWAEDPAQIQSEVAGEAIPSAGHDSPADMESESDRPSSRIQIGSRRQRPEAPRARPHVASSVAAELEAAGGRKRKNFPPPNIRDELPPELQAELDAALGEASLEDLIGQPDGEETVIDLQPESRVKGRVVNIRNEDIFVELGGRNQGIVSTRQFDEPPQLGEQLDLVVSRFNADDGLFECTRPNVAVDVANWEDVEEGTVVEVTVTGTNKGGLECQVAGIRGFIPMGQASLYHIENPEELLGQRLACLVTEASRARRNLVLSRKAIMEREKAQAREALLAELEPGQIREGVVRSLRDFGAFVDLGGVDGLIHVSQLSWDKIKHPSEVLSEGQKVKVRVEKVDRDTGKIGLAYRDLAANPWDDVDRKYPAGTSAKGTVSKIMDFGAFVRLEPGIEGLIHISELAHGRVWRTSDVVSEAQEVEVKILSVDRDKQRIGLSLKALQARPEREKKEEKEEAEFTPPPNSPAAPKKKHQKLKGGVGNQSGGERFGLKW
jgi:small subunit ribosomal protein S1